MSRLALVVSDLDGTMLGDDQATKAFIAWWRAQALGCRLVYASGRFVPSVCDSIRTHDLPIPDAIIGGVGTEICETRTGRRLTEWEQRWWPSWNRGRILAALAESFDLELQPLELQSESKISYYLRDASPHLLREIRLALVESKVAADLIYSSRRDLDIVPRGVNKGTAAAFLAASWRIPATQVVACGDSGNDLSLFERGFHGIVVANAQPELKQNVLRGTYLAQNRYAAGLVEGLEHFIRATCYQTSSR